MPESHRPWFLVLEPRETGKAQRIIGAIEKHGRWHRAYLLPKPITKTQWDPAKLTEEMRVPHKYRTQAQAIWVIRHLYENRTNAAKETT